MQTLNNFLLGLMSVFFVGSAFAQSVELREARDKPVPVAIQTFLKSAETDTLIKTASDLEADLTADLIFSRVIKVIPSDSNPKVTEPIGTLKTEYWAQRGYQYVVRGRVVVEGGSTALEGYIFDVDKGGKLAVQKTYRTRRKDITSLAHQLGDDLVELVTGKKGLFSTKIAFSYAAPNGRGKEIWVMDFNGRNSVPLVQNGRVNMSPEWTKDGHSIYYSSSSTIDWHIWKTDLNGRSNQVTHFKGSALGPAMMPNGRDFVVSLSKDGNSDIYLLGLDGKEKKRLTTRRGINVSPFPSPDGKKLCFSSDRLGNLHVFTIDIDTLETERITRVGTLNDSCAWSQNDDLILFSGMDTDREFDIFAMNSKGEQMERLSYDAKTNESPSFSPDGKLVAFSSKRTGKNQIYIMKIDGTQVTQINLPGDASQPSWSPRLGY